MVYETPYAKYSDVVIEINNYRDNNSLALSIFSPTEGPITRLTVNIDFDGATETRAFVDTNNSPEAIDFIEKYKIGEFTGIKGFSGYCTYPLYEFDLGKIKELNGN